jgi:hypothetical protein
MSSLYLSNPLGLWALCAVPVVILIHALQQRAKRLRVSTLFLLERVAPLSAEGARLERFRQSLPFWMQILSVLLLTWLLTGPRWLRDQQEQLLVLVLDTSASMSAYKAPTREMLDRSLPVWSRNAARTKFHLMVTDAAAPPLYTGESVADLLRAFDEWQPLKAGHDPARSLQTARGLVSKRAGMVVFITDHEQRVGADVALLSVAKPLDNVGFTGAVVRTDDTERMVWRAVIRNAGETTQQREWWIERRAEDGEIQTSSRNSISVEPGQSLVLDGQLSHDVEQAELVMTQDAFSLDDRMAMQKPIPKRLKVALRVDGEVEAMLRPMLQAIHDLVLVDQDEAVTVTEIGEASATDAILLGIPAAEDAKLDATPVSAEQHPLVEELNWSGLMTTAPERLPLLPEDQPLLWRGSRSLAFQRWTSNADGRPVSQLFLNWDLAKSNAHRLPAVPILLHRWLEDRRAALPEELVGNFETRQRLALKQSGLKLILADGTEHPWTGTVPEQPGAFEVRTSDATPITLVRGVAQFADARESDLRGSHAVDTVTTNLRESAERTSEADPLTALWLLALLGCLLTSWGWRKRS